MDADVADPLGIDRFAVMGHSGGEPHALACGAQPLDRVVAGVAVSGPAPFGAAALDYFAGMAPAGVGSMRAAAEGQAAKERYEGTGWCLPRTARGWRAASPRWSCGCPEATGG